VENIRSLGANLFRSMSQFTRGLAIRPQHFAVVILNDYYTFKRFWCCIRVASACATIGHASGRTKLSFGAVGVGCAGAWCGRGIEKPFHPQKNNTVVDWAAAMISSDEMVTPPVASKIDRGQPACAPLSRFPLDTQLGSQDLFTKSFQQIYS